MATEMIVEPGDTVKVYSTDFGLYFVAVVNDAAGTLRTNDELLTRDEAGELAASLRRQRDMAVLASAAADNRMGRAMALVAANAVRKVSTGVYEVRSQTHDKGLYRVRNGKCSCPDRTYNGVECKHEKSVKVYRRMQEAA